MTKKTHQTHFPVTGKEKIKPGKRESAFVWVEVGRGKQRLVKAFPVPYDAPEGVPDIGLER